MANKPDLDQPFDEDKTFVYSQPIFPPGYAAGVGDSAKIMAAAGPSVEKHVQVAGKERFEHMLLYCLKLLEQAQGRICAFYVDDFPDCDEFTLRVIQQLIARSGYATSDFLDHTTKQYKGFWAWKKK
ncbi:MAG TPA: hypothetical protein VGP72_03300 [Planctomycetota bacterium]|jgi:hypothetical protein